MSFTNNRRRKSTIRLDSSQREILRLCCQDNPLGRIGWPLTTWEGGASTACAPMIKAGLLIEKRLGGFPGVEVTEAGRKHHSRLLQGARP